MEQKKRKKLTAVQKLKDTLHECAAANVHLEARVRRQAEQIEYLSAQAHDAQQALRLLVVKRRELAAQIDWIDSVLAETHGTTMGVHESPNSQVRA